MDLAELDELEDGIEEMGFHDLLRAVLRTQVITLRKVMQMPDSIQVQVDAAFAGTESALAGLADRVASVESGLRSEVTKLTDENKKLVDELALAGTAVAALDTTAVIDHLNHLKAMADAIDGVTLPPPPAGSGETQPPGGLTGTVALDPANGKPLYTKNDPQITGNNVWLDASVEGSNGEKLYTFSLDTGATPTGDNADGGMWHTYKGTTEPIGTHANPSPQTGGPGPVGVGPGPGGTSPAGPPAAAGGSAPGAGATPGAPAGA